jgi:PKD repeat protein
VTVSATFGDLEFGVQSYVCSIDYGDGTIVAGTISGANCTGPAHQYKVTGNYAVTVSVTDSAGATGVGTSGLSYLNWEPWVGGGLVGSFLVGSTVYDVAIVEDPGASFETYTCTVDYGDGSPVQAGTYVPTWPDDGMPRCVGPDHIYSAPGSYSIVTTVTDSGGATGSNLAIETIEPVPAPVVGSISAPGVVNEGSSVSASATFEDASGQTHTCTVDYGDGAGPLAGVVSGFGCQGPTHKMARSGNFTITVKVVAAGGASGSATRSIAVGNVAPVVMSVSAGSVAKLGVAVSATATFTDPGAGETYKATWTWGDGTTTVVTLASTARSVTGSHTYSKAGLYVVGLTVSDGTASGSAGAAELAIYDPARTVNGSGSLAAPAGACKLSTACSKAATASFSVKASYARNAPKPTASLSFSQTSFSLTATSADWFVASTATRSATLQGTARVNGVTGYKFRLAMADGTVGGRDGLRLQVWNAAGTLVYDDGSVTVLKSGSLAIK